MEQKGLKESKNKRILAGMALSAEQKKTPKDVFSSGLIAELLLAKSAKTLVEFINTTTSLSSFLLTSVEWVTF